MMAGIDQPGVGFVRAPASPLNVGAPRAVRRAPRLGEHTDDLVTGLGMDPALLRKQGAVG